MGAEPDASDLDPGDREALEAEGPLERDTALERFDRWAWILCYALAGLGVVVGILAINGSVAGVDRLVLVASIFVGVAMLSGVAWGLGARRSWGRPAAVLLLWVLVALGIMRFALLLLAVGDLSIPVEAILAVLVLTTLPRGRRRDIGSGPDRSVALIYAGVYGLSALWPLVIR